MSVGVGVGGGWVGRPAPTQNFRRAARGGWSVGRPYPGRDRPRTEGRVGRSDVKNIASNNHHTPNNRRSRHPKQPQL
eukprot:1626068-Prymnesium_polylepis.1